MKQTALGKTIQKQENKTKRTKRRAVVYTIVLSYFVLMFAAGAVISLIRDFNPEGLIGFGICAVLAAVFSFVLKGYVQFLRKK